MPKRRRKPIYVEEPSYKKRRRHRSLSPSMGNDKEMENATKLSMLQVEVDVLRAQVTLLRREVKQLTQPPTTNKKDANSICIIM